MVGELEIAVYVPLNVVDIKGVDVPLDDVLEIKPKRYTPDGTVAIVDGNACAYPADQPPPFSATKHHSLHTLLH